MAEPEPIKADWYATDGSGEWSSNFEGPFATPEEALSEYLDQYDPEDGQTISVMRGRPLVIPDNVIDGGSLCEQIGEAVYEGQQYEAEWPDLLDAEEESLVVAVNGAILAWFESHPDRKPKGWIGYGKAQGMTALEARARVALMAKATTPEGHAPC